MNDFERLCAVRLVASNGGKIEDAEWFWDLAESQDGMKDAERAGMLAVLREMREQGGFLLASSRATWQGRIDVLIAQAEASESEAEA